MASSLAEYHDGHIRPQDLRGRLQLLLEDKEKQLQLAGTIGQRILSQQIELEERIEQLTAFDTAAGNEERLGEDTRKRLQNLAETLREWERDNSDLFSTLGMKAQDNGPISDLPTNLIIPSIRGENEQTGPSAAQSSRRAKNAAHRADDVDGEQEFAFEIGSGLLTEVRRLQSLLGERDKAIQDMKEEKDDFERSLDALRSSLQSQEQNADKFKEENWNLEVSLQELRAQAAEATAAAQRSEAEHKRVLKQLSSTRDTAEKYKSESEGLANVLEEHKAKHDTDIAHMRKTAAGLQRDKSDLQAALESFKVEAMKKTRVLQTRGSTAPPVAHYPAESLENVDEGDVFDSKPLATSDVAPDGQLILDESLGQENGDTDQPGLSTPDELVSLRRSYAHAQRQIATLKNSLMKEKELRLEQRSKQQTIRGASAADDSETGESDVSEELLSPAPTRNGRSRMKSKGRHLGRKRSLAQRLGMDKVGQPESTIPLEMYSDETRPGETSLVTDGGFRSDSAESMEGSDAHYAEPADAAMDPNFADLMHQDHPPATGDPQTKSVDTRGRRVLHSRGSPRPVSAVTEPRPLASEIGFGENRVRLYDAASDHVYSGDKGCQTDILQNDATDESAASNLLVEQGTQTDPEFIPSIVAVASSTPVLSRGDEGVEVTSHAQLIGDGPLDDRFNPVVSHLQASPKRYDVGTQTDLLARLITVGSGESGTVSKSTSFPFQFIGPKDSDAAPGLSHTHVDLHGSGTIMARPENLNAKLHADADSPVIVSGLGSEDLNREPEVTRVSEVNRTAPPTMSLPPPPPMAPPPTLVDGRRVSSTSTVSASWSMPPPAQVPERRVAPPPLPTSPPPRELVKRATTPVSVAGVLPSDEYHPLKAQDRPVRQPSSHRTAVRSPDRFAPSNYVGFLAADHRHVSAVSLHSDAVSSNRSRRSSVSSDQYSLRRHAAFDQPVDTNTGTGPADATDPNVIHAITQTMIGEFLFKYTRRTLGKGHGERRHKRYFWVHPYTKTLYWSSSDPGASGVAESNAKSAFIESVKSVLDPNPMPPGLYQYSVIVSTPQREMKFTAPSKERHDIWLSALQFLLSRPTALPITTPPSRAAQRVPHPSHSQLPSHNMNEVGAMADAMSSPRSMNTMASQPSSETWNITPRAHHSQIPISPSTSMRKRPGTPAAEYLRWGADLQKSPTGSLGAQGFEHISLHDGSELDFEMHDDETGRGYDGLENVRTCCNGAHTIGRHHEKDHLHHIPDEPTQSQRESGMRPVSPSGWSFRSRSGSARSQETGGIFNWSRSQSTRRAKA